MQSELYQDRRASTPLALSQPEHPRKTAVTITLGLNQRRVPTSRMLSSIFLKTQSGGFPTLRLPTNHE